MLNTSIFIKNFRKKQILKKESKNEKNQLSFIEKRKKDKGEKTASEL